MGTPLFTTYLSWYDKASAGMVSDNIHILNPGGSTSSGCVTVSGYPGVSWYALAGGETYVSLPAGTIGGPVRIMVNSGPAVKASQRVQFNLLKSFIAILSLISRCTRRAHGAF